MAIGDLKVSLYSEILPFLPSAREKLRMGERSMVGAEEECGPATVSRPQGFSKGGLHGR